MGNECKGYSCDNEVDVDIVNNQTGKKINEPEEFAMTLQGCEGSDTEEEDEVRVSCVPQEYHAELIVKKEKVYRQKSGRNIQKYLLGFHSNLFSMNHTERGSMQNKILSATADSQMSSFRISDIDQQEEDDDDYE